jgi:hypothetical protein
VRMIRHETNLAHIAPPRRGLPIPQRSL